MPEESEFGKGFLYNMFLFAKHWWRIYSDKKDYKSIGDESRAYQMWFYGAADHLAEFEIPKKFEGTEIGNLAKNLSDKGWSFRGMPGGVKPTAEDFDQFFADMERLMMLIDKELGVEDVKAQWN